MTQAISSVTGTSQNTTTATNTSKTDITKDEFLKLLTEQLKAQDPLNPADNQQFATQLAQFSQLEQLSNISSLLEEQVQSNTLLTQTISNTALPGLIGKNARALTNQFSFDGQNPVTLGDNLPYSANDGSIVIKNEGGGVIRTIKMSGDDLNSGEHTFVWDGKTDSGELAPSGKYTISVTCKDSNGASFSADTYMTGKIEAVRFKSEGTMLVIGGMEIALANISDITM